MKLIDMTGKKIGRLTVLKKLPPDPATNGGSYWRCLCECGNTAICRGSNLRQAGGHASCGCAKAERGALLGANKEFIKKRSLAITKHGHKKRGEASDEYKTWLGMKARCYRPKNKDYPNWGGRGITVCDRWKNSFEAFFEDMGKKPTPAYTIDRIDPDGNYDPSNCRWATVGEQGAEHRRGIFKVIFNGLEFPSQNAAARHFGIKSTTLKQRLLSGKTLEEALVPGRLKPNRTRESYLKKSMR